MHKLRLRSAHPILAALICLAVLLSLSTVTATAQEELEDPILNAAREAGLVTEIEQTQKQGDVTITLDWAYADTQRIVLGYTLQSVNEINQQDWAISMSSARLKDDQQASFSYAGSYSSKGNQPGQLSVVIEYYPQAVVPVEGTQDFTINNDYFNPPPDQINLTFDPNFIPTGAESALPFAFDFTLPLYKPVVIKETQSVNIKGVNMTLEQVSVTPTRTIARVCYNLPDSRDWQLESSVELNDMTGQLSGLALVGGKQAALNTQNRCQDMSYNVYHDTKPAALNINIDHLSVSMGEGPDDWNKIKVELAKRDILIDVISISHGLDVKVLSVPQGIDYDQAVIEAREALGDVVKGPWTFTVDLP